MRVLALETTQKRRIDEDPVCVLDITGKALYVGVLALETTQKRMSPPFRWSSPRILPPASAPVDPCSTKLRCVSSTFWPGIQKLCCVAETRAGQHV